MTEFRSIGVFDYRAPGSLPGALKILEAEKTACKVLAGGTDLILQMKQGKSGSSPMPWPRMWVVRLIPSP